jgi:predicted PurR-regulated permease PerM/GAF domain-containing protein
MIFSQQKAKGSDMVGGIFAISLTAFVIAFLYFARGLLIPLALSGLLTFLLTPAVTRLERRMGRIAAVLTAMIGVFALVALLSWSVTRQAIDLAIKLPDYKANIVEKLHSVRVPMGPDFGRFSTLIEELEKEVPIPGAAVQHPGTAEITDNNGNVKEAIPVTVVTTSGSSTWMRWLARPLLESLITLGFVLVLTMFMLIQRRDLRGRLIRLIGQGRISETTKALDDAGGRVARYLLMQLLINAGFGTAIGLGLSLIGVPNAPLWGLFAAILRFVPYVGSWIALLFPLVISLAAFPGWSVPLLALAVFVFFEVLVTNVAEPLLYRSSTGVSSIALIVAAFFWTWLWGPVGLVLATPLTVCLVVIGRHVPKLEFFAVLLGDEEPLTPPEEVYQRLLGGSLTEASDVVAAYARANSLTALYDEVLLPTVTKAESDFKRRALDEAQRIAVLHNVRDLVQEIGTHPAPVPRSTADKGDKTGATPGATPAPASAWTTVCVPAKGVRDEIAGQMLGHLMVTQGFAVVQAPIYRDGDELTNFLKQSKADAVCISVLSPSTVVHARFLCSWIRSHFPRIKIIVGLWGATEGLEEATQSLRDRGANEVVVTFAEAMVQLAKLASPIAEEMAPAEIPVDEEARLKALEGLHLPEAGSDPEFDRATANLAQIFEVPMATITLVTRDRQVFQAQTGLPADIVAARSTPRNVSICGHVVATNQTMIVEDLARDRRFANNPLIKERGLRFYAGVPLRAPGGQPVGSICLFDTQPRKFNDQEKRLLEVMAREITEDIGRRAAAPAAPSPAPARTQPDPQLAGSQ